jgi:hypothetical protein
MTFTVSKDGYVRCTYAALQSAGLTHRICGLDEDPPRARSGGVFSTEITGYTEWVDSVRSIVTLGWDWQMNAVDGAVTLRRIGEPRSNVMFVDINGADIGPAKNLASLAALVDAFDWQSEVRRSIDARYG